MPYCGTGCAFRRTNTIVSEPREKISALLELLRDENVRIASLAMEQMLKLGEGVRGTLAEYQEDQDPQLRGRIHQLGAVLARREARRQFTQAVHNESISLWNGVVRINTLYDPECSPDEIEDTIDEFMRAAPPPSPTAPAIASFMREFQFAFPEEDLLDIDLYLIERVLGTRYGAAPLLCALAMRIGEDIGWHATVVLHDGRFCLIDEDGFLLDPAHGWHMERLRRNNKLHPCSRKDVWLVVLAQIFAVALFEGNLRDLHHFADLLANLDGADIDGMPYPLGTQDAPPTNTNG